MLHRFAALLAALLLLACSSAPTTPSKTTAEPPPQEASSARPAPAPAEVMGAFSSADTLAIARVKLGRWDELELPELLTGLASGEPSMVFDLLSMEAMTAWWWEAARPTLDSARDAYVRVDVVLPEPMDALLEMGIAFHPPPVLDHSPFRYTVYLPSTDPSAMARALRERGEGGAVRVRTLGTYVEIGDADAVKTSAVMGPTSIRRTPATELFLNRPSAAAIWLSAARLRSLLSYQDLAGLAHAVRLTPGEQFTRMYAMGLAEAYKVGRLAWGGRSEFEDHAFALTGPGAVVESAHTHTLRGREIAASLSDEPAVGLPALTPPPNTQAWLNWEGALDTRQLHAFYVEGSVQRSDLLECMQAILPTMASVTATLSPCLRSSELIGETTPLAARVIAWSKGEQDWDPRWAALLVYPGGQAEADAIRARLEALDVAEGMELTTKLGDGGTFSILLTTDPVVSVGEVESVAQGQSSLDVDLTGLPAWTGHTGAASLGRLGASYQITPAATFARFELLSDEESAPAKAITVDFEPLESPRSPRCHEGIDRGLQALAEFYGRYRSTAAEERPKLVEEVVSPALEEAAQATRECERQDPARAAIYRRIRATAYLDSALIKLVVELTDEAKGDFATACELGEPLACGDAVAYWSLETCPEPFERPIAVAARPIEADTSLTRDHLAYECGAVGSNTGERFITEDEIEAYLGRSTTRGYWQGEALHRGHWSPTSR